MYARRSGGARGRGGVAPAIFCGGEDVRKVRAGEGVRKVAVPRRTVTGRRRNRAATVVARSNSGERFRRSGAAFEGLVGGSAEVNERLAVLYLKGRRAARFVVPAKMASPASPRRLNGH